MPDTGRDQPYRPSCPARTEPDRPSRPRRTARRRAHGTTRPPRARDSARSAAPTGRAERTTAPGRRVTPTTAARPATRPADALIGSRGDGVRLAMTGRIPAPVRDRVLAEYRADLAARCRATVAARVRDGVHPQRTPYGYRVEQTGQELGWTGPTGRAVVAPPYLWVIDPGAADAVAAMVRWCLALRSDAWIAAHLAADRGYPGPTDPRTGRPTVFTPAVVAGVLTHPVYTGHQTWGRTRGGRPQHPDAWIMTTALSHPALIDRTTFEQLQTLRHARRTGRARPGYSS